jgi:hypothetical protein
LFVGDIVDREISKIKRTEEVPERDQDAILCIQTLFEVDPSSIDVHYSNKDLLLWEAACTWQEISVQTEHEENPKINLPVSVHAWVQLRESMRHKKKFLFYRRSEILAHEYIHCLRAPLMSKKYEEIFAYSTSLYFGSSWRAYFGPFFSSSGESTLFVVLALLSFLASVASFFEFVDETSALLFPLALFIYAFFLMVRLYRRQRVWQACKAKVGLPRMLYLQDHEVELYAS